MVCRINESAEDDCVEKREYETIVTKHMFRLENRKLYICNNHWMTEFKTILDKEVYGQEKWKNVYFSLFVLSLKLSFETLKIRTSSKYWLPIKSENKSFNVLVNESLIWVKQLWLTLDNQRDHIACSRPLTVAGVARIVTCNDNDNNNNIMEMSLITLRVTFFRSANSFSVYLHYFFSHFV